MKSWAKEDKETQQQKAHLQTWLRPSPPARVVAVRGIGVRERKRDVEISKTVPSFCGCHQERYLFFNIHSFIHSLTETVR